MALYLAQEAGARAFGIDIDEGNLQALDETAKWFSAIPRPQVEMASVLDGQFVQPNFRGYDIVHSWGVLHHTGDIDRAITEAACMVKPGGFLVLAIYNTHWSSPAWLRIKWVFNKVPDFGQHLMVAALCPVILAAKWAVTRKNPFKKNRRGMDFYHDLVDWVGGYPYEHKTIDEVCQFVNTLHFETVRVTKALVPTGCNEFVFQRRPPKSAASAA